MKIEVIETERLILRPLALSDATDLHRVYSDADTMRFWNTPPWGVREFTVRDCNRYLLRFGTPG